MHKVMIYVTVFMLVAVDNKPGLRGSMAARLDCGVSDVMRVIITPIGQQRPN